MQQPIKLQADNFTPPTRTPWGGRHILAYKAGLPLSEQKSNYAVVGESWELSVSEEFPSFSEEGVPLQALIDRDPAGMLGVEADRGATTTSLLVKWLDAAHDLSLQIHPSDTYRGLGPGDGGKPECWYVVRCDPDARLYLGLREGTDQAALQRALRTGADIAELLHFVPVRPGDVVLIPPGAPHAIGGGVTLIEPQRVSPGRRGVTYRYWDWNRRYDERGAPDPQGTPRPLHVTDALSVTDWTLTGPEAVARLWHRFGAVDRAAPARLEPLCGPEHPRLPWTHCRMMRLSGDGETALPGSGALTALTVIEGELSVESNGRPTRLRGGQTAALPASLGPCRARAKQAHALLCVAA